MRKLFKKSLACLLAAILCATVCIAAIPASAEAITYSTNAVVATPGETVNIDFTVANFSAVKGAMIKLYLPTAIASVDSVLVNGAEIAAFDEQTGAGYYKVGAENGVQYIKFMALFGDPFGELASVNGLTFNITATVAAEAAEGTYEYAAPVFSVTEDGTTLADVTGAFGTFEVVAAGPVEPTYDDEFRFKSVNVTLASSIALNFDMDKTTADAFDSAYVVFKKPVYDVNGNQIDTLEVTVDFANKTNSQVNASRYSLTFPALYPQDLGATITATPYGVKDGVSYVGRTANYCILTFIKNNYSSYPVLFSNMLNYGTVVQTVNSYNTANMIDAAYTALVGNEDWKNNITAETPELTSVQTNTDLDGATARIRAVSVSLADKVIVNLRTSNADKTAELDYTAGYQMKITYTNANGAQEKIYDITSEYVAFDALSASEMSVAYTAVIIDAKGNEVSNTFVSSIESFCQRNPSAQTIALMKYGNSVAALNG